MQNRKYQRNITGKECYEEINNLLGKTMNNIRIVIGKHEIYPNTELIELDKQEICGINIKTRMYGGMYQSGTE